MMSRQFDRVSRLAAIGALLCAAAANASVIGDSVSLANTFTDSVITGGDQAIFDLSGPIAVATPDVEATSFATLFDIDIDEDSILMTLTDNAGVTDLILPANRFDRYYVSFDDHTFQGAALDGDAELNAFANLVILDPGTNLNAVDTFGTNLAVPVSFPNGGLLIEFGEGADFSATGVSARVNFSTQAIPEPSAGLLSLFAVAALLTWRKSRG